MKKQFLTILLAGLAVVQFGNAQEKEKKFGVKWGGYVKGDYIFDSRRIVDTREGQYIVIPQPEIKDAKGNDLNAESGFNSFAIESRLGATITGPDAFGMKTKGFIEAHFFGASGADINSLGMRHAFFTLSNDKVEILFGQYWHPGFVTNVSPGTHAFNAGVPYQPFNRSPQLRISTKGNVRFIGAILTERDFKTAGGSVRYATLPTVHAQLQFGDDAKFVGGAGINVKTVETNSRFKTVLKADNSGFETIPSGSLAEDKNKTSLSFLAYAKANLGSVTWKLYGMYGGNTTEQLMFGGYGVNKDGDVIDSKLFAGWTEFSGKISEKTAWGLFVGYTKDTGYGEAVTGAGNNVESSYRISPRLDWTSGKVRFGVELGYTVAQYGEVNPLNGDFVIKGIDPVGNFRTALHAIYFF